MDKHVFISDFSRLGKWLQRYLLGKRAVRELDDAIMQSLEANRWFTKYHIKERLAAITNEYLQCQKLEVWLARYPDVWDGYQKEIAVVMAGNIPLAGYHDYLSVLASGRRVAVKLSSKDAALLPALHDLLCSFAPEWRSRVRYVAEVPQEVDGLITSGSDVTARWFLTHYPHLPKIVRGHRASVAVVPMEVTSEQISGLHRDMFAYFGLGCRSVVRLFLPKGFDLLRLTTFPQPPKEASHSGFRRAYQRQKALFILQERPFIDGGFFLLQEQDSLSPPMATIYYTFYSHINEVIDYIKNHRSQIQCVVGIDQEIENCINFGSAQTPSCGEYADGIDTMRL